MRKFLLTLSTVAMASTAAMTSATFADGHMSGEEAISTRQAIMWANNDVGAVAGAMLKGQIEYNPLIARAALKSMRAGAHSMEYFFPKGTTGEKNNASPKIWEDPDGFAAAVTKFKETTDAAVKSAGMDGPADIEAFKAAVFPVFGACTDCHESYRIKR